MQTDADSATMEAPVEMRAGEGRLLDADESRYMQGSAEPATSSVLISNSKYLNSPFYRDAFSQFALRRHGHDLPNTYVIPMMIKALDEVADYPTFARLIAEERTKKPEFADWLDARVMPDFRPDTLRRYPDGTLGALIRAFVETSGYDIEFMKPRPVQSDIDYIVRRRSPLHDIEHMITGFGPNSAGEQALAICNTVSIGRYFTPELAQMLSHTTLFVSAAGYMRTALHYPALLPTYTDAMRLGIAMGQTLSRPLFMEPWEAYLDWTVEEVVTNLGINAGPGDDWAWTTEAGSG